MNFKSALSPLVPILVLIVTSGCASITGTNIQSMSLQTMEQTGKEMPGAACELTNKKGKWFVTSPGSVTVTRSNDDMQVLCQKEGVEPGRASVVSDTKGTMFGNIIFGGGIGAIVDHNTGAAYEYPVLIQVKMGTFTKIESPKTPPAEQQGDGSPNSQPAAAQPAALRPEQGVPAATASPSPAEKPK